MSNFAEETAREFEENKREEGIDIVSAVEVNFTCHGLDLRSPELLIFMSAEDRSSFMDELCIGSNRMLEALGEAEGLSKEMVIAGIKSGDVCTDLDGWCIENLKGSVAIFPNDTIDYISYGSTIYSKMQKDTGMHFKRHMDNTQLFKKLEKATTDKELRKMVMHAVDDSAEATVCLAAFFAWGVKSNTIQWLQH